MDLSVLKQIAIELDDQLRGGFINKIHQPLPREIVLRVRAAGPGERKLMLSADPQLGRVHLTKMRIPNPPRPPRFCAFLRAHLQGWVIHGIRCENSDRVLRILCARKSGESVINREFVVELLGRDSNLILLDCGSGLIMDCLHHIPVKEPAFRIVLPGQTYSLPPERTQTADIPTSSASPAPGIEISEKGRPRLTISAPTDSVFPSMNEAAEAFYEPKLRSLLLEAFRREIAAPMRTKIANLDRRTDKILGDLERLKRFSEMRHMGELIKANLGLLKKGMTSIQVNDWETSGLLTIELNPALGPVENMEALFKKSAKARRGEKIVQARLEQTKSEKKALEDSYFFIENAADIEELEKLSEESRPSGKDIPPSRQASKTKATKSHSQKEFFRKFVSPSGFTIFVGTSAKSNDMLVKNKAKKGDLWLHIKDFPGAHVLIAKAPAQVVSNDDIQYAAGLAVFFSKAKNKGKVDVILSDAGDVERPKGGFPGQVVIKKYKTISAEASDSFQTLE